MSDRRIPLTELEDHGEFARRHIGPDEAEVRAMLADLDLSSLEELVESAVPKKIRGAPPELPPALTEAEALDTLARYSERNQRLVSLIGLGYYNTFTPPVIRRNVLENPGWYTAYTPYQAEIAQGRLEALLNFQQMVIDLTAMELANASLLDEATAAAEAMALAKRVSANRASNNFFVDRLCLPQTIDVLRTRAGNFGFELIIGDAADAGNHSVFGALFQYPDCNGNIQDFSATINALHEQKAIAILAALGVLSMFGSSLLLASEASMAVRAVNDEMDDGHRFANRGGAERPSAAGRDSGDSHQGGTG